MPILSGSDLAALRHAAQRLAADDLVAFATETVYGLGARADSDAAVAKIFAAKGRPQDHPLIVHVASPDRIEDFAAPASESARALMQAFWPGALTLILPRRKDRAAAAAGGQPSIGLRMPSHPVALALLEEAHALGVPGVAAPSANRFGRVSPTRAAHVAAEFGDALIVLDGGDCPIGIESAIVDLTRERPALLRPGMLGAAQIERVLQRPLAIGADATAPRASGTLDVHYAPNARVLLLQSDELQRRLASSATAGARVTEGIGVYSRVAPHAGWLHRAMPEDAAAAAHELFAVLREFDALGVSAIWVEQPPPGPDWDGVRDRLGRAAAAGS